MRGFRFCFLSLAALMLFAALLIGRRELYLLLFMMGFVAAAALLLNLWTIFSFTFVQELSQPSGGKGSLLHLNIGIHNDNIFPFTLMCIHVETALPSENVALRFNLSPLDSISFKIPLYCAYRGEYQVGMTICEITDIFGLFTIHYDLRMLPYYRQRVLKIYPRLTKLCFLPAITQDSKLSNNGLERISDNGENYTGLRQYRAGDPLKRIHWTASARVRKLITKSYSLPADTAALIALDNSSGELTGEARLKYADLACECACAIASYCMNAGFNVRLLGAGFDKPLADEKSSFLAIYNILAVLPFNQDVNQPSLPAQIVAEANRKSGLRTVYALTFRQSKELSEALVVHVKNGCDVKCLFLNAFNEPVQYDPSLMSGVVCASVSFGGDIMEALEEMM